MGFSDIFSPSSQSSSNDAGKQEVFRQLTEELIKVREENRKLELSQKNAIAERKEAINRMREMEDTLRLKEGILDTLEQRIENLELENNRLLSVETELSLLRQDQAEHPLSSSDASYRYDQLSEIFSQLRDTLSCAVCYEPYIKEQATSLLCGHSFCRDCFSNWEQRHVEAWKLNPHQQGVYPGPDCPECRSKEVRRGKVRIWALEETVRLVDRAVREIEKNRFTPKATLQSSTKNDGQSHSPVGEVSSTSKDTLTQEEEDEESKTRAVDSSISVSSQAQSTNYNSEPTANPKSTSDHPDREPPPPRSPPLDSTISSALQLPLPSDSNEPDPPRPAASLVHAEDVDMSSEDLSSSTAPQTLTSSFANDNLAQRRSPLPSVADPSTSTWSVTEEDDLPMEVNVASEDIEEARNLLRPRTPNPYIAVFRR